VVTVAARAVLVAPVTPALLEPQAQMVTLVIQGLLGVLRLLFAEHSQAVRAGTVVQEEVAAQPEMVGLVALGVLVVAEALGAASVSAVNRAE
jgi:hypothetical protein